VLPRVGPGSCRIGVIQFLAGRHNRQSELGFGFVRFSFAPVSIICCLGFLCCHLVVVTFLLLVRYQASDWLERLVVAPIRWLAG